MNTVILTEYSSEKYFVLFEAAAFTPLCSDAVVFRAMGGMFAGPSVDIIFLGLNYFELPNHLRGVRVFKPGDEEARQFGKTFAPEYDSESPDRVYAVESNDKRFHVIGAAFWVLVYSSLQRTSALEPLNDLTTRDQFIERNVKEWYKIE